MLKRAAGLRPKRPFAEKSSGVIATEASYTLDRLLAGISPTNLHDETDWGPAVGNEIW